MKNTNINFILYKEIPLRIRTFRIKQNYIYKILKYNKFICIITNKFIKNKKVDIMKANAQKMADGVYWIGS